MRKLWLLNKSKRTIRSAGTGMTMHQHGVSLSHCQLLFLAICLAKYCQIGEYHDGAWNPEWYWARYYRIHSIHLEFTYVRMRFYVFFVLVGCVPSGEYRNKWKQCRRYPCVQNHNCNNFLRYGHGIFQWFHNRIVSGKWGEKKIIVLSVIWNLWWKCANTQKLSEESHTRAI